MTISPYLSWWYIHLFSNATQTHQLYLTCSQSYKRGWHLFETEKIRVPYEQDLLSCSRYPSGSTWTCQLHRLFYTWIEYNNNTNRTTLIHWILYGASLVLAEFRTHRVSIDSEAVQAADERCWTVTRIKVDCVIDLPEEAYLSPILASPRKEERYTADTDARDRLIRHVLLQNQDENVNKLVEYWSKILNDLERNLDTTHR